MELDKLESSNTNSNRSKKLIILFLVLIGIGLIATSIIYINHDNKDNNGEKETNNNTSNDNKENKHIDLETIRQSLNYQIQNNNKNAYIVKCKNIIKDDAPAMDETYIRVNSSTVDTIIEKLKTADSYEEFVSGYESCPPKNIMYYVGGEKYNNDKQFLLDYAVDENALLIGYFVDDQNRGGYKFIFKNKDDIKEFIESLEITEE